MPATDNMTGPDATRPGDVLRLRNGKTIEVLNTDAEGRLVLADALAVASEAHPDAIVDVATLTGACKVALGSKVAGVMGNDDGWLAQVEAASKASGEAVWRLPLPAEYRKAVESSVADMKNIGGGDAGALVAGLILQEFVGDGIPWAHLDIAGTASSDARRRRADEGRHRLRHSPAGRAGRTVRAPGVGPFGSVGRAGRGGAALTARPERALEAWMTRRWGTRHGHD